MSTIVENLIYENDGKLAVKLDLYPEVIDKALEGKGWDRNQYKQYMLEELANAFDELPLT